MNGTKMSRRTSLLQDVEPRRREAHEAVAHSLVKSMWFEVLTRVLSSPTSHRPVEFDDLRPETYFCGHNERGDQTVSSPALSVIEAHKCLAVGRSLTLGELMDFIEEVLRDELTAYNVHPVWKWRAQDDIMPSLSFIR